MKERSSSSYEFVNPLAGGGSSIIKVLGVGGGGSNAVNHMQRQGIRGVDFYVFNTDIQALNISPVPEKHRIQIGGKLTAGLGAGANPEVGRNAALESKEQIREILSDQTKMVFITAGMGGGTGTGAAPVIAEIAKSLGILTVGIVTMPFEFEGKPKFSRAESGINELRQHCDTVLVILNNKLKEVYGKATVKEAFNQADNVLTKAAKSIAEIITVEGEINVDFEDVRTVMRNSGAAVMGSATAEGENRARRAAEGAINSPLLNNTNIAGARYILLSIVVGNADEFQMDELEEITEFVRKQAGDDAELIFGQAYDDSLGKAISVTIIATGFDEKRPISGTKRPEREVVDLESNKRFRQQISTPKRDFFDREDEDDYFTPPPPAQAPQPKKPEKVVFQLEGDYELLDEQAEEEKKKRELEQQYKERMERMNRLQNTRPVSEMTNDELKERQEIPAYQRRGMKLNPTPHSSEPTGSRSHLDPNNEILGNNRFLHDNVD